MLARVRFDWRVIFPIVITLALFVADVPRLSFFLALGLTALIIAWCYSQTVFYAAIVTAPLLGWTVSFSTDRDYTLLKFFGETLEMGVAEAIVAVLLVAWLARIFIQWIAGQKPKIIIPLAAFGLLVLAHLLSAFSPVGPDKLLVMKYALRPVLWAYLTSVLLPVNFIRTKRHLVIVLTLLTVVGAFFALDGLRSLPYGSDDQTSLPRAHPRSIFGVYPIGINHNVLAELLIAFAPMALALVYVIRHRLAKRWSVVAAILMTLVAFLTFARSAWIALIVQFIFLSLTIWRPWIKKHLKKLFPVAVVIAVPLIVYMAVFMQQSGVRGSTDTRATLTDIAINLFHSSPYIGVGAGTFVGHVSNTFFFTYEFGDALDSHGILQKLAAETGFLGLLAFLVVLVSLALLLFRFSLHVSSSDRPVFYYLTASVLGAFVYQLFNTTYWTSHLWLPVGILLATIPLLTKEGVGGVVKGKRTYV